MILQFGDSSNYACCLRNLLIDLTDYLPALFALYPHICLTASSRRFVKLVPMRCFLLWLHSDDNFGSIIKIIFLQMIINSLLSYWYILYYCTYHWKYSRHRLLSVVYLAGSAVPSRSDWEFSKEHPSIYRIPKCHRMELEHRDDTVQSAEWVPILLACSYEGAWS